MLWIFPPKIIFILFLKVIPLPHSFMSDFKSLPKVSLTIHFYGNSKSFHGTLLNSCRILLFLFLLNFIAFFHRGLQSVKAKAWSQYNLIWTFWWMNLKGKIESSLIYNTLPDLTVNTDHHSFGNIYHKAYAPSLLLTGLLSQTSNVNNRMLT